MAAGAGDDAAVDPTCSAGLGDGYHSDTDLAQVMFDLDDELTREVLAVLEATRRDNCDDFCDPITNRGGLRTFRYHDAQPREEYL